MTKERVTIISGRDTPALLRAIMAGKRFRTYGALSAERYDHEYDRNYYTGMRGRLSNELFARIGSDCPDYVVYSYSTPIAWHVPARDAGLSGNVREPEYWVVPDDTYSVTTSKHQGIVRHALVFATKRFPWPYGGEGDPTGDGVEVREPHQTPIRKRAAGVC